MRKSLGTKLFYNFAAIIIALLLSMAIGISYLIYEHFFEAKRDELIRYAQEIAINMEKSEDTLQGAALQNYLNRVDGLIKARIWVLDERKQVIAISRAPMMGMNGENGMHNKQRKAMLNSNLEHHERELQEKPFAPKPQEKNRVDDFLNFLQPIYEGKIIKKDFYHPTYQEQVLFVGIPIMDKGKVVGAVLISSAVSGMRDFIVGVYVYIGLVMLVAIFLSLVLVNHFSKNTIAPLLAMQKSAAAMAKGDYSQEINIEGDDEVADLGRSLNSLAQDLNVFVEKMQTQEKIRRDFVANVSHELRTPLTIIGGYNQAISDGTVKDQEKIKSYQNIIRDEVQRLERLIKDLLDLSRLQAGQVILKEKIPLAELVSDVVDKMQIKVQGKDISFILALEPIKILADGDRLVQLMIILLDNAIKYTPAQGEIKVSLNNVANGAVLEIRDTGKGIPQEDLPYIWERFYKVDKSHSRLDGGIGVGLAIAKEIVMLHKGQIKVESELNQGTSISIDFPIGE